MRLLRSKIAKVQRFNGIFIVIFQGKDVTLTEEQNKHFPHLKFHYSLGTLFSFPS